MPGLRCWCEIDLKALRHNVRVVRGLVGPRVAMMPVVKADAYGHGLEQVARALDKLSAKDCRYLGCACVQEGEALRRCGIKRPVLLLSSVLADELARVVRAGLTMTISSVAEARLAAAAAAMAGRTLEVHVKVDTGMGRLGAAPVDAAAVIDSVRSEPSLVLGGFYTHYASADEDAAYTLRQWRTFQKLQHPGDGVLVHVCNSSGLTGLPRSHADMVRPGILLYGVSARASLAARLKPVMTWKSKIIFLKQVAPGTPLSYGASHRTTRRARIANIAVGYGDGLFRSLSNRGSVLINSRRCPIVGRVTMDQILVDVTRAGSVNVGDEVVLIGRQGKAVQTAAAMARDAGTIPYEIWCHITRRVVKLYS